MKTYRNHHTRNRTRRRRMKGGYYNIISIDTTISKIKGSDINTFKNLDKRELDRLFDEIDSADFKQILEKESIKLKLPENYLTIIANLITSYQNTKDKPITEELRSTLIENIDKFLPILNAVKSDNSVVGQRIASIQSQPGRRPAPAPVAAPQPLQLGIQPPQAESQPVTRLPLASVLAEVPPQPVPAPVVPVPAPVVPVPAPVVPVQAPIPEPAPPPPPVPPARQPVAPVPKVKVRANTSEEDDQNQTLKESDRILETIKWDNLNRDFNQTLAASDKVLAEANKVLQPKSRPLTSEEQKQFLKGRYKSLNDPNKTICENTYPEIYNLLESGIFETSDIVSLLNSDDRKVLAFFTAIGYDKDAKTIMGHPLAEVYRACHPDRGVFDADRLTRIFQVLKALESYTGIVEPRLSLKNVLKIASKAAAAPGVPGSKPDKSVKKRTAVEDFPNLFKKGDTLVAKGNAVDPGTGKLPIITVVEDYNPETKTIKVAYEGVSSDANIDEIAPNFIIIHPQKRLFKKDDQVLIKNTDTMNDVMKQKLVNNGCKEPFHAIVLRDQEQGNQNVYIKCSKAKFIISEIQIISLPTNRILQREVLPESTPQNVLNQTPDPQATVQRRGDRGVRSNTALPLPANIPDCDKKIVAITSRATACEENIAKIKVELQAALDANAAQTAKLEQDKSASQQQLNRLTQEKRVVESDLARQKQILENIRTTLRQKAIELGTLNTQYDSLNKQKIDLEVQLRAEQGKSTGLQSQLTDEQVANLELQTDLRDEQGKSTGLQGQIGNLTTQLRDITAQKTLLQTQYDETQVQLRVAEASLADLNSRFATTDALIRSINDQIRGDLVNISTTLVSGIGSIQLGIQSVVDLENKTQRDIAAARTDFNSQFNALQRELAAGVASRRNDIVQAIQLLRQENQTSMAGLQQDLAAANEEKGRLQEQLGQEQAAKAAAEAQLAAKNEEIARKEQEHTDALQAARQEATNTAEQIKTAQSDAEIARLTLAHTASLETLKVQLALSEAWAVAAQTSAPDLQKIQAELAAVAAQIASLPATAPPPAPVNVPKITGREPPISEPAPQGSVVKIKWDPNTTRGPWILRVDYDGKDPDFQEVNTEGDIDYEIKRQGALTGTIYNVIVV
jgi:hypothetical protein